MNWFRVRPGVYRVVGTDYRIEKRPATVGAKPSRAWLLLCPGDVRSAHATLEQAQQAAADHARRGEVTT